MILPTKHVTIRHSLIGQAMIVLQNINRPKTVSTLWDQVKANGQIRSYERFVLAIDMLFMLGAVELNEGLVRRVRT
jgi:hypothetical protein